MEPEHSFTCSMLQESTQIRNATQARPTYGDIGGCQCYSSAQIFKKLILSCNFDKFICITHGVFDC